MTFAMTKPVTHPQLGDDRLLTYIVGEPGVGKSTLAEHLFRGLAHMDRDKPFAHRLYTCGVYELGKRRPDFPGTDALSMSVQPQVLSWMDRLRPFMVFGEGDRLGTTSFLDGAEALGYTVRVWNLAGPEVAALHRRIRGSEQDEQWIAGRRTKVTNLVCARGEAGGFVGTIQAGASLLNVEQVMAEQDPLIRALVRARSKR